MANNRLYILDRFTGETFLLASTLDEQSWNVAALDALQEWLSYRDFDPAGSLVLARETQDFSQLCKEYKDNLHPRYLHQ